MRKLGNKRKQTEEEKIRFAIETWISEHSLPYSVKNIIDTLESLSLHPADLDTLLSSDWAQENREDNYRWETDDPESNLKTSENHCHDSKRKWQKIGDAIYKDYLQVNKKTKISKEELIALMMYLDMLREGGIWPLDYHAILDNHADMILDDAADKSGKSGDSSDSESSGTSEDVGEFEFEEDEDLPEDYKRFVSETS